MKILFVNTQQLGAKVKHRSILMTTFASYAI